MGKKADALNRLETDLNDLKNTINDRFSKVENLLLQLTERQTRSPPQIVSPDNAQMEKEGDIAPVENNNVTLATGKRKTSGDDTETAGNVIAAKKSKGDQVGKNVGTSGSDSSDKAREPTAVTSVTDELTKAISMLKSPEELVQLESLLRSIKMPIIVNPGRGEKLNLEVHSSETIDSVKAKIYDMIRIKPHEQKLIFGTKILEGCRTLAYYNIQKDSTLDMIVCSHNFQLYVYVVTLRGERIAIAVQRSDTINDVKAKIHEKEGIPARIQRLIYSGKELENDKTIEDCRICDKAPVYLTLRLPKAISAEEVSETSEDEDDVETLEEYFETSEEEPDMRADKTAEEVAYSESVIKKLASGILMLKNPPAAESRLALNKIVIYVKALSGKTWAVQVESSETIDKVKAKIYDKEGISLHLQRLIFEGKELKDDQTVYSCNIQNRSTIHLIVHRIRGLYFPQYVYVITLRGEKIALPARGLVTINDVKAKIHEVEGIPTHIQKLIFCRKELPGHKPLHHYSFLEAESDIKLTLRL